MRDRALYPKSVRDLLLREAAVSGAPANYGPSPMLESPVGTSPNQVTHKGLPDLQGGESGYHLHLTALEYAGTWGHPLIAIATNDTALQGISRTAMTDEMATVLAIQHQSSGNMADDFGPGLRFDITDTGGSFTLGRFGMVRDGADTTGAFVWQQRRGSAYLERMRSGYYGTGTDTQSLLAVISEVPEFAVVIAQFGATFSDNTAFQNKSAIYSSYDNGTGTGSAGLVVLANQGKIEFWLNRGAYPAPGYQHVADVCSVSGGVGIMPGADSTFLLGWEGTGGGTELRWKDLSVDQMHGNGHLVTFEGATVLGQDYSTDATPQFAALNIGNRWLLNDASATQFVFSPLVDAANLYQVMAASVFASTRLGTAQFVAYGSGASWNIWTALGHNGTDGFVKWVYGDLSFLNSTTERLRLTAAGAMNLGGQTTATTIGQLGVARLYLNSTAYLDGASAGIVAVTADTLNVNQTNNSTFSMTSGDANYYVSLNNYRIYAAGQPMMTLVASTGQVVIGQYLNAAGTTRVSALMAGNVGINTINPLYQLDVNGYTNTSRLYLNSTAYLDGATANRADFYASAGLLVLNGANWGWMGHDGTNAFFRSSTSTFSFLVSGGGVSTAISATGAIGMIATQKLYLDGVAMTGDTYITESSANVLDIYAGGVNIWKLTANGGILPSGKGLYLDGGTDTYIIESSANVLDIYAGNTLVTRYNATGIGLFGVTPVAKQGHQADPAATTAALAIWAAAINLVLERFGLQATA